MRKALVPVDGSDYSLSAVRHAMKRIAEGVSLDIHLLNIRSPLRGDIAAFVPYDIVHDYYIEEANKALKPACALLGSAGIPYTKHIYVGPIAELIADCAQELHCDQVIMGTRGLGPVMRVLLGSISHQAIHQMDPRISVTLIKAPVRRRRETVPLFSMFFSSQTRFP